MIVVALYTVGRLEYLEATLESFAEKASGPVSRIVAFDDSGDPDVARFLEAHPLGISVASWGRNLGYSASVAKSWRWLLGHALEPWVFHLEEDFVFDVDVDLAGLVAVLEEEPALDQVALLRGPWFPSERRAGGIVERAPERYTSRTIAGLEVLEHREIFTCNPSIYRRELCRAGWPDEPRSERLFTRRRVAEGRSFAYLGDGAPWISHIGRERRGHGY